MKRLFFLELVPLIVVVVVISGFIYMSITAQENKLRLEELGSSQVHKIVLH